MARNTYRVDESYEEVFNIRQLLVAGSYIRRYAKPMALAILLSAIGGAAALIAPMITQKAIDEAIPNKDFKQLGLWLL